jgi:hypothetical protein
MSMKFELLSLVFLEIFITFYIKSFFLNVIFGNVWIGSLLESFFALAFSTVFIICFYVVCIL